MTKEQKKKYLEHFEKLNPLFDMISDRSGQSWWSPPGEDWHFICDTGYVAEFLNQLEEWLNDGKETPYNRRKPNSRLINSPKD